MMRMLNHSSGYIGLQLNHIQTLLCHKIRKLRNIIILFVSFLVCLTFFGCENRDSISNKGHSSPYSVVFHSVPFATGNRVWDEATLIGSDKYGRELYLYEVSPDTYVPARDLIGSEEIGFHILVISQKTENGQVYYYEDQCYLLLQSEAYSVDDVHAIKTANDWNKPYDISKMVSVSDTFDQKNSADKDACIESFCETVAVDDKYKLVFDEISVKDGEILCVLREYYTETNTKNSKDYFFGTNYIALFNKKNELIRYTAFEGSFANFPAQIESFKKGQV